MERPSVGVPFRSTVDQPQRARSGCATARWSDEPDESLERIWGDEREGLGCGWGASRWDATDMACLGFWCWSQAWLRKIWFHDGNPRPGHCTCGSHRRNKRDPQTLRNMATFATVEVYPLIIQQYDEEPSGGSGSSRSFVVIGTVLLCLSAILFLHSQLAVSHSLLPAEVEATTFLHGVSAGSAVPDVFCFTVMGQPDLERALLLSQQKKGKGVLLLVCNILFSPHVGWWSRLTVQFLKGWLALQPPTRTFSVPNVCGLWASQHDPGDASSADAGLWRGQRRPLGNSAEHASLQNDLAEGRGRRLCLLRAAGLKP